MKTTTLKISNTLRNFFKYSYRGDGKYYTTVAGSRHYNNTEFQSFYNKNKDCVDILETGNDAPRGGKTGEFVIVKFNENFTKKYAAILDFLNQETLRKENEEKEKQLRREESAILAVPIFEAYLTPEKKEELKNKLSDKNSKGRKNYLKLKSINLTGEYYNYPILEKMIYA